MGDGLTDDSRAIARCWQHAAGGPIYYPAGQYLDSGSHAIRSGQIVFGDGAGISVILSRSREPALTVLNSRSWTVRDLSIMGGASALEIRAEAGFGMLGLVSGIEIWRSSGDGIVIAGAWNLSFRQVRVRRCGGAGFRIRKSQHVNPAHLSFDTCRAEINGGPGWSVSTPDAPPTILGLNWINCTATFNATGYDLSNVVDATWIQSYSASDVTGIGARLNRVVGATFIGGGFHTEATAIDLTASVATVTGTFFNENEQHVWAHAGSRGTAQACYVGKATTPFRVDDGATWEVR